MKTIVKILIGCFCLGLTACGAEDKGATSNGSAVAKEPNGDLVVVSIFDAETKGNPAKPDQGFGCSFSMSIENKSDKEISLVQIMKYTAKTIDGSIPGRQSNFALQPNETTKRAGIYIKNTECKNVTAIQIDEVLCFYKGGMRSDDPALKCSDKLFLKTLPNLGFVNNT